MSGVLYTDLLTDREHVSLAVATPVCAAILAVVFGVRFVRERTLSIHSIVTRPREAFYWLAILVTFALGTAATSVIFLAAIAGTVIYLAIAKLDVIDHASDAPTAPQDPAASTRSVNATEPSQPCVQPSVVALDPVVRVMRGVVDRVGNQLRDDTRQRGLSDAPRRGTVRI